jgi:tetratricopeptide (TPR) repeat protein
VRQRNTVSNDFSGEAATVLQAGTVYGGIKLEGRHRSFPAPNQLPARPSKFVNRHSALRELDRLASALATGASTTLSVSAVSGAPGVGKTALALYWAHHARHWFPDGSLYIDMRGFGPGPAVAPTQALDSFLRALDMPSEDIPETLEERASLYRSLLDGRRVLVLVDNASSSAQVRQLIPAAPQCFTLITSRSRLSGLAVREGAVRLTLEVLTAEESLDLLRELIGRDRVEAELPTARRVAQLCGHLPLALRVVADRVATRADFSLAELVEELVREQNRLDALASTEDELSDTRAVFSWSYSALTIENQQMFRRLSLHAGVEFGAEVVAALAEVETSAARQGLRKLTEVHLVQEVSTNRFRLHDLLRSYSAERALAEETQDSRTRTVRRMLSWYLLMSDKGRRALLPHSATVPLVPRGILDIRDEFAESSTAMTWFELERANIQAALRIAAEVGQYDMAWKIPVVIDGFLELHSYWHEWEASHQVGLQAASALGDPIGEACNLAMLGDAFRRNNRLSDAAASYERAARLGCEHSVGWVEGFSLRGLGLIHEDAGDVEAAVGYFRSALRVFRDKGLCRGEALALLSLGKCDNARGNFEAATASFAEAVAVLEEIQDRWTVAWAQVPLAAALRASGELGDAERALRGSVQVFREFGDGRSEILALVPLGEALRDHGDVSGAHECWTRALSLHESLGDDVSYILTLIRDLEA